MNSHNAKTESFVKHGSVRIMGDKDDVRVIASNLDGAADLAISEDSDPGGDPYNNTGQQLIIKSKLNPED